MSAPGFDPAVVEAASAAQRAAADPRASVFVEANAGSGKTRVLVDRVARLLLAGAAPERILCVTFTKAAAGEMQSRLFRKLGAWSVLPDEQLREEMAALTGGDGAPQDIAAARRLFARALETPGGLKIQTLHAFCESLLRRFPLEAGLAPGFEVQENASALAAEAIEAVYGQAARDPGGPMAQAIAQALDAGGAEGPANIAAFALARRHELGACLEAAGSPEALMDRASAALKVHPDTDEAGALEAAWDETPVEDLEAALSALQSGTSVTEAKSTAALAEVLDAATRSGEEAINAYLDWVLTKAGEFKAPKSLYGKALAERYRILTTLYGEDGNERHRINDEVLPAIAAARANAATRAALRIALAVIAQYEARLKRLRKVDFADLVVRARALLTESELGAWVRYKLDAGLDHVLVDEAQDTAPDQWAVVNALTEEFFSGAGVRTDGGLRTVFCVGDEKQSIYSFQKADPRLFLAQRAQLQVLSEGAGLDFASPALDASFRSAPEVLEAVDAAFAAEAATLAAPERKDATSLLEHKLMMTDPETDTVRDALAFHRYAPHRAARQGMPGCVEIWPAIPRPESPAEDVIEEYGPLDAETDASARNQLAEAVASEIAALIERGDAVWEEGKPWRQRPATPGDVLVLVRRRKGGLFEEIIRRLKMKNVPVAGADRMTLPDQLVVEDLLSLARFLLLPEDDLALAEILKSPLFHPVSSPGPLIDDDALYALSQRPGRGLWEKLRHSDDPRFSEARAALDALRGQVETRAPYALFAGFLTGASGTGESRLARIYARLGEEARDPVEEFLSRALAHEREGAPSLARFAAAMAADSGEIKREMEAGRGEVRVMTVHGAKGLEAPIVFLPDTTSLPRPPKGGLHAHAHAGLIWAPDSSAVPPLVQSMKERAELDQDGEYNRLLYVALTRARDRLVVCGFRNGHGAGSVAAGSWHERCSLSWRGEGWSEFATPVDALARRYGWTPEPGLRLGEAPPALGRAADPAPAPAEPGWMRAPAPAEPAAPRTAAPSRLLEDEAGGFEPVSLSPLAEGAETRFRRGSLIHKLLQTLPDLPPERRASSAERYLAAQRDLTGAQRAEIIAETLRVLDDPQFAALFAPGSRAEVSVSGRAAGLPDDVIIHGQIDRLVVTGHDVMIVDYKTNRPPPETADQVADAYLAQMAAYRALLQGLYEGKPVRCALLWTDGPRLMELPAARLDAMQARLSGRARA